ncbi:EB domain-containing protein [Aphelenchoides bicaudatus]|nr:EB domain-containing protein [Aphelenchoides bicaudatus]
MKQTYGAVLSLLLLANSIYAEPMPIELRVNISNDRDLVRRQALGAPFYGGGCCPGCPCCPGCMAAPPPIPPAVALAPPPLPVPAPCPACAPPPIPAFAPLPPPPVPAVPAPAGRLIPQALPGICLCPPELVQEGTVCVSRTIYGVVPGVPPPPPLPPVAPAIPVAYPPAVPRPAFFDPCIIKRSAEMKEKLGCKQ